MVHLDPGCASATTTSYTKEVADKPTYISVHPKAPKKDSKADPGRAASLRKHVTRSVEITPYYREASQVVLAIPQKSLNDAKVVIFGDGNDSVMKWVATLRKKARLS